MAADGKSGGWRDYIDLDDILNLPKELANTFKPSNIIAKGYPWGTGADVTAFLALWGDNLATQLSLLGLLTGILPGWPTDFAYKNFMPGVGISLFLGNLYYTLQASKVANETNNPKVCAQPYGINTPGGFAKTFGIIFTVYFAALDDGMSFEDSADKAWKVACACNFVSGLVELLASFIAVPLLKMIPMTAILAPICGIGFVYLHFGHFLDMVGTAPLISMLPFALYWVCFTADVNFKFVPLPLLGMVIGGVACWITEFCNEDKLDEMADIVGGASGGAAVPFSEFGEVSNYISIILPISLINGLGSYMCVASARVAGDNFNACETMVIDGLGTMVGAFFGSPYGTTVYIGHPAFRKMGATRGYSLVNGILYLIMGFTGLHALVEAVIGLYGVYGILAYVGVSICAQATTLTPPRWYPALFVGISIAVADWGMNAGATSPGSMDFVANGYVFTTIFYTWALCMMTDRKFLPAAGVWGFTILLALVGLIHSEKVSLEYNEYGTIKDAIPMGVLASDSKYYGSVRDGQPGWKYIVTYFMMSMACLAFFGLQRAGLVEGPDDGPIVMDVEPAEANTEKNSMVEKEEAI